MSISFDSDAFELKRMMKQDAHEKAFEAHVTGQRIYESEKDKQITIGSEQIDKEFQSKLMNLNIEQKILISATTNEARIKRMKCRNDCVEDLRSAIRSHMINEFRQSPAYKQTLKTLIVQVSYDIRNCLRA